VLPQVGRQSARRGDGLLETEDDRGRAVGEVAELFEAGILRGDFQQRVLDDAHLGADVTKRLPQRHLLGDAGALVAGGNRDFGATDLVLQVGDLLDLPFGGHRPSSVAPAARLADSSAGTKKRPPAKR
jgi:hypothetical protein